MGVCQPTVACLAATAILSQQNSPFAPASLILMAGPIDVAQNPTKVNELATSKPLSWFEDNLIGVVPLEFDGAGRNVYPGFLQLMAFMSMNPERHAESFKKLYDYRIDGEDDKADAIADFYAEYFAIMDLSASFYLQTIQKYLSIATWQKDCLFTKMSWLILRLLRKPSCSLSKGNAMIFAE